VAYSIKKLMEVPMGDYLTMADIERIKALIGLGWSYRHIERETGVRRETIARYDPRREPKAANVATGSLAKPAKVTTGFAGTRGRSPGSAAEPFRKDIEEAIVKGLSAQRIWQDLVSEYGFGYSYSCIKRYVRQVKKSHPEVADVLEHLPGKEAQVDYFQGPPTFDSNQGKWRRPWVFRMTLSCSRHGYEEAMWTQEIRHFISAHEHAFEDFGGVPEVVRHDYVARHIIVLMCPI
jgi:transposase